MSLNFCIAGGRGFIGKILRRGLSSQGRVYVLSRKVGTSSICSSNEFIINWNGKYLNPDIFKEIDIFINLSGESIYGRLNARKRKKIYNSRIYPTRAIVEAIKNSKVKPGYFFQASAIGIYKEQRDFLTENSPSDEDFLANVVKDWEREVEILKEMDIKLFIMRFGVVLGKDGGVFKKLNPLIKTGLFAIPGKGNNFISWIYEKDLWRAFYFLLRKGESGVYNFTSPHPVMARNFFKQWGFALKKPVFLHIPFILLRLILGREIKSILGKDLKVYPEALVRRNFNFSYTDTLQVFEELTRGE